MGPGGKRASFFTTEMSKQGVTRAGMIFQQLHAANLAEWYCTLVRHSSANIVEIFVRHECCFVQVSGTICTGVRPHRTDWMETRHEGNLTQTLHVTDVSDVVSPRKLTHGRTPTTRPTMYIGFKVGEQRCIVCVHEQYLHAWSLSTDMCHSFVCACSILVPVHRPSGVWT